MTPKQKAEHQHCLNVCKLLDIKVNPGWNTRHLRALIEKYKRDTYSKLGIKEPKL